MYYMQFEKDTEFFNMKSKNNKLRYIHYISVMYMYMYIQVYIILCSFILHVYMQSTSSATTEEEDYEIARALMMTEKEQQLKNDYKIASLLQKQYEESNAPNIKPPFIPKHPPPPPLLSSQLPLQQLPFMPTTKQLVSTTGRLRKLKSVTTKEKRGFRLGMYQYYIVHVLCI